jgi:hypothetical protein
VKELKNCLKAAPAKITVSPDAVEQSPGEIAQAPYACL